MTDISFPWHRYATIAELVRRARSPLGRTAVMKLCYFLQAVRGVDLGYDFRLYTYGPFDPSVLGDLAYAQHLGAVAERSVHYPTGAGYEILPGAAGEFVRERGQAFLREHEEDLN